MGVTITSSHERHWPCVEWTSKVDPAKEEGLR